MNNIDILEELKEELDEILKEPIGTDEMPNGNLYEYERGYELDLEEIKAISNLIVENKELKERNKTMLSDEEREALRNFKSEYETCKYNSSDLIIELDDAKILSNLFKNLIAENKELKEKYSRKLIDFQKEREEYEKYYIQKSKVKAKIKQLDYNDIGNYERRCKREVLQELLGKE